MPRGRRPESVRPIVYSVKLVLRPGVDDDLIDYLHSAGPRLRATMINMAMRNGRLATATIEQADEELSFDQLLQ